MSQLASLSSWFTGAPPTRNTGTPRFPDTQSTQQTQSTTVEQTQLGNEPFSIFAEHTQYNEPYAQKYDYIHPSIVPDETHARMDLNYVSWVVRNALTIALEPINQTTEQINKGLKATIEVLSIQNESLKHTVDILAKQMFEMTKNQDKTSENLHRLQQQLTNLSVNRPSNQAVTEGRTSAIAAVTAATITAPTTPANNPNHPDHPQQPKGKALTPPAPKSYASAAAGNTNLEFTTVTNKKKNKPKADPLFKPEIVTDPQ
ncbi:uncharacterized protein LAJ45_02152 [Morchella importuna]|uniref:uncharacterized protein n=1 Tax=Morchella importuna TaxID=1174673 RepID=UPI001E8DB028|nr:uncharacterized protein LAJ45_02152 [Morchella importuna]KAH8153340.1 hypothetical protein LAJ45_02152 [Morchella importuna]